MKRRNYRRNYSRSKRNKKLKLFTLCLIIFVMFIGIGKSIGDRLMSKSSKLTEQSESVEDQKNKKLKKSNEKNNDLKEKEEVKEDDKKKEESKEEIAEKDNKKVQKSENENKNSDKEKGKSSDINKGENLMKQNEDDASKIAYLTFDDGPSTSVTPQILDILDTYDVKATFFVIGSLAEQNPDLIKREYKGGHAIGNHTYSHNYKYIYGSVNNFLSDIDRGEKVLKSILGNSFHTDIVRFPGGSFGNKKEPFKKALIDRKIAYIDWNALNGDAEGHNIPSERLIQRVVQTTKGKNKVVILMHDAGAKKTTVKALPDIIKYLKSEGYVFKAIKQEDINEQ